MCSICAAPKPKFNSRRVRERASWKPPPVETVGPFGFAQYNTLNLFSDTAFRTAQFLKSAGYRAIFTADFDGLASKTKNSRGLLPDLRSNCFAAILAGLR